MGFKNLFGNNKDKKEDVKINESNIAPPQDISEKKEKIPAETISSDGGVCFIYKETTGISVSDGETCVETIIEYTEEITPKNNEDKPMGVIDEKISLSNNESDEAVNTDEAPDDTNDTEDTKEAVEFAGENTKTDSEKDELQKKIERLEEQLREVTEERDNLAEETGFLKSDLSTMKAAVNNFEATLNNKRNEIINLTIKCEAFEKTLIDQGATIKEIEANNKDLEEKNKDKDKQIYDLSVENRNSTKHEKVIEEVNKMFERFKEVDEQIREVKNTVIFGHDGVKGIVSLWENCDGMKKAYANSPNREFKQLIDWIVQELEIILIEEFDVKKITPAYGEEMNYKMHTPMITNVHINIISKCIQSGWRYNDKVIKKAVVE